MLFVPKKLKFKESQKKKLFGFKKQTKKVLTVSKIKLIRENEKRSFLFTSKFIFNIIKAELINVKVLIFLIENPLLKNFYQKISVFTIFLFQIKFNVFIDFLKTTTLFYEKKITAAVFLAVLGDLFKILPQKKHNRFFFCLQYIFQIFLQFSKGPGSLVQNQILGIKFIASGKLQGKPRSSSCCIQVGAVPVQSIENKIEVSKIHVSTLYGAFSFKIWVYRN